MFFEEDRIIAVREMIVAKTCRTKKSSIRKIITNAKRRLYMNVMKLWMENLLHIRFLDPPLHEFLPHDDEDIKYLANEMGIDF